MKKITIILITLLLSACSSAKVDEYIESTYPVEAQVLILSEKTEYVKYVGILQPEKMVQKTFSNLANIEKIYVAEGDEVKVGDLLAKQDTTNLSATKEELALQVTSAEASEEEARQNMLSARAEYNADLEEQDASIQALKDDMDEAKAQRDADAIILAEAQVDYDADPNTSTQLALTTAQTNYNQSNAAYLAAQTQYNLAVDQGASTQTQVSEAQYNAAQARYEASQAQTELTRTQYANIDEQIANSYLYANINGYVLSLIGEEGEVANPLIPVMVLGTSDTVATIGLSQANVRRVQEGMVASVKVGDLNFEGKVLSISRIPDSGSRTYETYISFGEDLLDFFIGENTIVNINVGQTKGIWIPIKVIQSDGEDYVFVVKDDRVKKKIITTRNIDNDYVLVEGLQAGDVLITKGFKNIKPGNLVNIINGIEE